MAMFWILIFVSIIATNSLEKAESVELEELPLQTFNKLFLEEWWDKDEAAEELKTPAPTNFGQIELNSTDQNLPLTESDQSDNAKNIEEQNEVSSPENITEDERKRKIIDKFHAIKEEFKQKGIYSKKEWNQIDHKIAKGLKVNRTKLYEWKKELGLSQKMHNFGKKKNDRKNLIEKFDQMKAELKRAGLKSSYPNQINEIVAKELGLCFRTIYNWKRKFGQTEPNQKYPHSEQKELLKRYYKIKDQNPKISDKDIAKTFKIGGNTLYNWKKQFKPQQFHPNSVDGHSVEENATANIQEIGCSNSGRI